ncbi:hypothetical protein CRM22_008144 [Opisthorchis felineus]|uniref:Major facilitator superfamily associated domain-containing protein n=1 Tax=Opisthorchis felineus TaxID=147828 RepID=A0A4S2LKF1_OPIFE|nr:hypothetical protein CRM22_008144 [Opisthorchis felineus]
MMENITEPGTGVFTTFESDNDKRPSVANTKRTLIEWIRTHMDRSMLVFQLFYFFFYAAFGSLFPLISIYFKQLGLNAIQCGILSGIRSFVECLATPFWNALAEKWKKGKSFLLASLVCSMSFTLGLGFVRPSPEGCLVQLPYYDGYNETSGAPLTIIGPYRSLKYDDIRSVDMTRDIALNIKNKIGQSPLYLNTKKLVDPPKAEPGGGRRRFIDQNMFEASNNYRNPTHYPPGSLVMPLYSTVVYSQNKINQIFIIIILLVLFGELLSCPAIPLVDALVAEKTHVQPASLYGQQRTFGSIGWGLAMFCIGLALDNASRFPDYPCLDPGKREKNYMVCFATYSVFMAFALFTATQLSFTYEGDQESMYFKLVKDKMARTLLGRTTKNRSKLVNEENNVEEEAWKSESDRSQSKSAPTNEEILEKQLGIKLGGAGTQTMHADKTDTVPEESYITSAHLKVTKWVHAMHQFCKPRLLAFLFVTWFMGLGVGQVFTFLFWHVQELDGSPTLFGIATIINHVSEIIMFYFSKQIIDKIGHLRVLYLGLFVNIARFLFVSWITNPWWILPFELAQGLTHAGVWVACCSYITQAFTPESRSATLGFLKVVHYGLGRGLGACLGGLVISSYGSATMFRSYGAASAVVLLGFLVLNYVAPIPAAQPEHTDGDGLDGNVVGSYGQLNQPQPTSPFVGGYPSSQVTHEYYTQQSNQPLPSQTQQQQLHQTGQKIYNYSQPY